MIHVIMIRINSSEHAHAASPRALRRPALLLLGADAALRVLQVAAL